MLEAQHRISLRFRDPDLEARYQSHVAPVVLAKARLSLILALSLYVTYALIDPIVSPERAGNAYFIRFAIAVPFLVTSFGLSYLPLLQRHIQGCLFVLALVLGGVNCSVLANGDARAALFYPAANMLLFMWAYVVSGLNHVNATIYCGLVVIMYAFVSIVFNPVQPGIFGYHVLQLGSTAIIGLIAAYLLELYSRRNYVRTLEAERANRKLEAVVDTAVDAIVTVDDQARITAWNPAAERMFGYPAAAIMGETADRILPSRYVNRVDDGLDLVRRDMNRLAAVGTITVATAVRADGTEFSADLGIARWEADDTVAFTALIRDVTERKQAEFDLRRRSMEARLLHQVSETATASETVDQALERVIQLICREIDWPVGHAYKPAPEDARCLVSTGIWFLADPQRYTRFQEASDTLTFGRAEGLPGRVYESAEPEWISNLQQMGRHFLRADGASNVGLLAAFAIPVTIDKEPIAVLEFFSPREFEADTDLKRIMRNVGVQTGRVLERRRVQQALALARQQADAANKAKSAFLANMSHELRTPMNAILGYSEMMIEEADDAQLDELSGDLEKIHGAGAHLLALINDVLDLSKIEAGKMEVFAEPIDLPALIEEVVATARPLMEKNANTFSVQYALAAGEIYQDQTKLRQVLLNLLSNSAKFTREGEVCLRVSEELKASADGSWLVVEVEDSGVGIPEQNLATVFETFSQAHAERNQTYGGTGLGLSISQRYCNMLGGDLTLESQLGEGSTFTVRIPIRYTGQPPGAGKSANATNPIRLPKRVSGRD